MSVSISHWQTDQYGWTKAQARPGDTGNLELEDVINSNIERNNGNELLRQVVYQYAVQNSMVPSDDAFSLQYYYLFIGLALGTTICFVLYVSSFFFFGISSSNKLYYKALDSTIRTQLSFFDTTPQGRIINRLVKDCETVDFLLVRFFILLISATGVVFGNIITMCVVTWPSIIIVVVCLLVYGFTFAKFR